MKRLGLLASATLFLASCHPVAALAQPPADPGKPPVTEQAPPPPPTSTRNGYLINLDTVVVVDCTEGQGTGTIIGRDRVLTANHVVFGDQECKVNGKTGTVIAHDDELDYAVLKVDLGDTAAMPISCDGFRAGDSYLAVGYAWGRDFAVQLDTFTGWWAPLRDEEDYPFREEHLGLFKGYTFPGMSGGPVFDGLGRVTGIVIGGTSGNPGSLFRDLRETKLCAALADAPISTNKVAP